MVKQPNLLSLKISVFAVTLLAASSMVMPVFAAQYKPDDTSCRGMESNIAWLTAKIGSSSNATDISLMQSKIESYMKLWSFERCTNLFDFSGPPNISSSDTSTNSAARNNDTSTQTLSAAEKGEAIIYASIGAAIIVIITIIAILASRRS